jgi:Right handed beta helix region
MIVDKPLRILGDEENPSNVVIEMAGSIQWTGNGGWIEGITFRRPKLASGVVPSQPMLSVSGGGRVDIVHSIIDNDASTGSVVQLTGSPGERKGTWTDVIVRNGGSAGIDMDGGVLLDMTDASIRGNKGDGIKAANQSSIKLVRCTIERNEGFGVRFPSTCKGEFLECTFEGNKKGIFGKVPNCGITSSLNAAVVNKVPQRGMQGFKFSRRKADGSLEEVTIPRSKKAAAPSIPVSSNSEPVPVPSNPPQRVKPTKVQPNLQ